MVPVLSATGSLMAYLLYPDPIGTLQEHYGFSAIPRQYLCSARAIPPQSDTYSLGYGSHYTNAFGCTGQPIIRSLLKIKNMAKKTATSGASADRIKTDPAFERTRENMEEFTRAGKAAKFLRTLK